MTGLFRAFKTTPELVEGKWFDLPEAINADGSIPGFKLAFAGKHNPKYGEEMIKATEPVKAKMAAGILTPEEDSEIMREVFTKSCLLDWRNIVDSEGNSLKFKPATAKELLKELPELFERLYANAIGFANFTEAKNGIIEKN